MASRLTVVVSQSVQRDAQTSDLEETLVAEVMMAEGMDATMVGPLKYIDPSDTDYLCLSSFNYSFVLLSWESVDEVRQHWERLQLGGHVIAAGSSQESPVNGSGKRILYLQLDTHNNPAQVLARLRELLRDRQVKTVPLSLNSLTGSNKDSTTGRQPSPEQSTPTMSDSRGLMAQPSIDPERPRSEGNPPPSSQGTEEPQRSALEAADKMSEDQEDLDEPEWEHLDRLVEDFDQLDL